MHDTRQVAVSFFVNRARGRIGFFAHVLHISPLLRNCLALVIITRGQLDRSTAFLDYIFDLLVKRGQSVENVKRL